MALQTTAAFNSNQLTLPKLSYCDTCQGKQPCGECVVSLYVRLCGTFGTRVDPSVASAILTRWDLIQVTVRNPTDVSLIPLALTLPHLKDVRTLLIGSHVSMAHRGDGNWICRAISPGLPQISNLRVLDLQRLGIDGRGLRELSGAICSIPKLTDLILRFNYLGKAGGTDALVSIVKNAHQSLRYIDISCNSLGYLNVRRIEKAAGEARKMPPSIHIVDDEPRVTPGPDDSSPKTRTVKRSCCCPYEISVEGNFVVEEIWNSVLHGIGVILGLVGTWDLLSKARGQSDTIFWACFVYGLSATTLFTASTMYHSTFLHERTRRVFQMLDHCAIFILIAGTYTPIGLIGLSNVPAAIAMVVIEWLIALVGITVYLVSSHWPRLTDSLPYVIYEVVLYVLMYVLESPQAVSYCRGHMCFISYEQIIVPLSKDLLYTLVLGGALYVAGVVFFVIEQVKHIPIMHCIWHVFVLAAAIVHFFSVRSAVVNHLYASAHTEAAIAASKPFLSGLTKFHEL